MIAAGAEGRQARVDRFDRARVGCHLRRRMHGVRCRDPERVEQIPLVGDGVTRPDILYRIEESRGYSSRGALWSPGLFQVSLSTGHDVILVASTECWDVMKALSPDEAFEAEVLSGG